MNEQENFLLFLCGFLWVVETTSVAIKKDEYAH